MYNTLNEKNEVLSEQNYKLHQIANQISETFVGYMKKSI